MKREFNTILKKGMIGKHTFWEVNIPYKFPANRKNVFFVERFRRRWVKVESRQGCRSLDIQVSIKKKS